MKKIIFLLGALWCAVVASAQPSNYVPRSVSETTVNSAVSGTFHAPAGASPAIGSKGWVRSGAMYVDTTGGGTGLWVYVLGTWKHYTDSTMVAEMIASSVVPGRSLYTNDSTIYNDADSIRQISLGPAGGKIHWRRQGYVYWEDELKLPTFLFGSIDTITTNSYYAHQRQGFWHERVIRITGGLQRKSSIFGSQFSLDLEMGDTIRLDPAGGDQIAANVSQLGIRKLSGYSGVTSIRMGTTVGDASTVQHNNFLISGSTSSSNYTRTSGPIFAEINYLNTTQYDSVGFWGGTLSRKVNSGYTGKAIDFWAGLWAGSNINTDSLRSFVSPGANAQMTHAGPIKIGLDPSGPIPGQTLDARLNPILGQSINSSLMFDVISTTKASRPAPTVTGVQMAAIASPAAGFLVYNSDSSGYCYYTGSAWVKIASGSGGGAGTVTSVGSGWGTSFSAITGSGNVVVDSTSGGVTSWVRSLFIRDSMIAVNNSRYWSLSGNSATSGSQAGSFLGTTNSVPIRFKTNGTQRVIIDSARNQMMIGAPTADASNALIIQSLTNTGSDGVLVYSNNGTASLNVGYAGIYRNAILALQGTSGIQFNGAAAATKMNMASDGKLYISGSTTPTAWLHLGAGTTTIAPIRLTSGPLTTSTNILAGNIEFLTDKFYGTTTTGPTQYEFTMNNAALTSGTTPVATTNGRLTDGLILASGTYTPTLTNTTNVSSSTAFACQYMRVGSTVTVSGKVNVNFTTAAGTLSKLEISLPIASNFANDQECSGTASDNKEHSAAIRAETTGDTAELYIAVTGTATGGETFWFTFTYRII